MVNAPGFFRGSFARVVEELAVDHPPEELLFVPRELREDHRVDGALASDSCVAVHRVRSSRPRAARLEHSGQKLQREVHDVTGGRARKRRNEVDVRERSRRSRPRSEHPQKP